MRIAIKEKRFGDKLIFSDVSFDFPCHKRTAILAPSGKGKTTLMRMLSGLDDDFTGTIDDPPELPVVLFQEDRLSEGISALSNLIAVTDDREGALLMLKEVGLEGEEHTLTSSLSGGMKRRLAIARVLLLDSDALFLDEPFSGLDGGTKKTISSLILRKAQDKTIIFITHSEEELELLAADCIVRL